MLIKAGSALLVPRNARMDEDVAGQVADNGQLSLAPEVALRRVVVKAGKKDTLESLAKTHRVTVAQLAEWNELNSQSKLQAGQSVVLFLTQAANGAKKSSGAKKKTSVQKAQAPKGDKLAKR